MCSSHFFFMIPLWSWSCSSVNSFRLFSMLRILSETLESVFVNLDKIQHERPGGGATHFSGSSWSLSMTRTGTGEAASISTYWGWKGNLSSARTCPALRRRESSTSSSRDLISGGHWQVGRPLYGQWMRLGENTMAHLTHNTQLNSFRQMFYCL